MSIDLIARLGPARAFVVATALLVGAAATAGATPLAACKPDASAKGIPLYDKPGGTVVRTVDVEAGWQGGPGLSLMQGKDEATPATMWLEVKDASGTVVGYLSGADGGITCQTPG